MHFRPPFDRRTFLQTTGILAAGFGWSAAWADETPSADLGFARGRRPLVTYPGKRPLLRLTARPPQLETPMSVFREGVLTPNDAFFVRYHHAGVPTAIDTKTFRLQIQGHVKQALELSLDDIKTMLPRVEIVAVNQCSGNSRGFSTPRVGGGQLGHGAMGNARWAGVSLKALLDKCGVKANAVDVAFRGLDEPVLPASPAYEKSLPIDHARDDDVMLAYAMNSEDLPMLNGFPLRLVVPGHFGTYWVKHVRRIEVRDRSFEGFWMKTAYRIPDNDCACIAPGTKPDKTRPIGRFAVRSFITSVDDGATVKSNRPLELGGIAFDGGSGIKGVEVSIDGGSSWRAATLGEDLGRYSFRPWTFATRLGERGTYDLRVRATSQAGESQPEQPRWNPAGYLRNVIESVKVRAV